MKLQKVKIKRNPSDFFSADDISDPISPELILTINNFDNKGLIFNPLPPCVASCIDPDYKADCDKRQKVRKFMVKSDVLKLRNITRTKFFSYKNQERALEKEREKQFNKRIYENIKDFYEFCFERMAVTEKAVFREMQEKYDELHELQQVKIFVNKRQLELQHQQVYTKVVEIYRRFRYLLKLIDYFDNVSEDADEIEKFCNILDNEVAIYLNSIPEQHSPIETDKLKEYMDNLIRPYLKKKNYLNVELWKLGYQNVRRKMFNYNRHLTRVALLNHIMSIIYDKFLKNHSLKLRSKIFLKDPDFLRKRSNLLKIQTIQTLDQWEEKQKIDKINAKIVAVVPTMASRLQLDKKPLNLPLVTDDSILEKIGKIQAYLLDLLHELDAKPPIICKAVEKEVRERITEMQVNAKQSLVMQTRLKNLLGHYKNHYKKKNIVYQYTTLIRRPKSKNLNVEMAKKEKKNCIIKFK